MATQYKLGVMRAVVRAAWTVPTWVGLLWVSASCEPEPRGQLTLAIQTDMKLPEDVDEVRIEVLADNVLQFGNTYSVGGGSNPIPATLALVSGRKLDGPLEVRLIARQRGRLRTLREVVTTIPQGRNAMLRLPVQWLCDGFAKETSAGTIDTTCPGGRTCVSGRCVEQDLDSELLPEYAPEAVYGGSEEPADGRCLDTIGCFAEGLGVPLDADCTFAPPADEGEGLNVAIVLPPESDGVCGPHACLIPLDEDPGDMPFAVGFRRRNGRVELPKAVCDKVQTHEALGVAATVACSTKSPSMPTCGPWSAVTSDEGVFDAPAPEGIEPPPIACAAPEEKSRASVCITLQPELLATVEDDPELDGRGVLVVEVYDRPNPSEATLLAEFASDTREDIDSLPEVTFDGLPATIYVRAGLFDNSREEGFAAIERGGAWVGGTVRPGSLDELLALDLNLGQANEVEFPIGSVRRLQVTVSLEDDVEPADGADGLVSWRAYPSTTPFTDADTTGTSERPCADLSAGHRVVVGHVYGAGPHFVAARLDDFGTDPADGAPLGSLHGSLVSGGASSDGASWEIPDSVALGDDDYIGTLSVSLTGRVNSDQADTLPFSCPTTDSCDDGEFNGTETDEDCGGECLPCADGRLCAGPGDCESRVCGGNVCAKPTCYDGVQNGQESDQDCGGECVLCQLGGGCRSQADCEASSCIESVCSER